MKKIWLLYFAALWTLLVIADSISYVFFHRVPTWPTTVNYYAVLLAAYCVYAAILIFLTAGKRLQRFAADASSLYYFCLSAGVATFTDMMAGSAETASWISYPPWEHGPPGYHLVRAKVIAVSLATVLYGGLSRRKLVVIYGFVFAILTLAVMSGYHSIPHAVD